MTNRQTRGRWAAVAVLTAALVVTVAITSALGGGGFLTKKKANKQFAKKTAVYTKSEVDGKVDSRLPLAHSMRYMVSPDNWVASSSGAFANYGTSQVSLGSSGGFADRFYLAAVVLPQTVQGRTVKVDSFELCYAAPANVTLDRVFLAKIVGATAGDIDGTTTTPIDDDTDRTDTTCRTYAGAAPVPIDTNDFAQIVVRVDFAAAASLTVTRLSLNLST